VRPVRLHELGGLAWLILFGLMVVASPFVLIAMGFLLPLLAPFLLLGLIVAGLYSRLTS